MAKTLPWHRIVVERVFQGGPTYPLAKIAAEVKQSEKACDKYLRSQAGQDLLATYHAARRNVLAQRGVRPLEELGTWAHEAARGLVASMWLAAEAGSARELRESSVAILAHLGHAPVKKVEKNIRHQIDTITDPLLLSKIINGEEVDFEALPSPKEPH
jgi:hypothetical protein